MRLEFSAGGIVFKRTRKSSLIAFILDPFGKYTFPKGHIEKGERPEVAALRETMEETGMRNLQLVKFLGKTDFFFKRASSIIHKFVYFYLMEAPQKVRIKPQKEEKIQQVKWVSINKALGFSEYKNVQNILKLAIEQIKKIQKFGVKKNLNNSKAVKLEKIAWQIRKCKRCPLWKLALNAVPGEGNPKAEIMFIGEAPGRKEDESGLPFVGKSGKFLDVLLRKIKLDRKKVFITSVLKHRPPNNRKPKPHELSACRVWWKKQMEIINPKVVVLLGEVAYKEVLQRNDFSKKRGEVIKIDNRIYLPTFHPSAAVRFSKFRKVLIKDFNKILNKARL